MGSAARLPLTLRVFLKWTALFFLVVEALGLLASLLNVALKMTHSSEALSRASWVGTALELTLRFAIVGLILSAYLHLRNVSHLPLNITRQSALLTTRAAQSVLLATIALYATLAERIAGSAEPSPLLSAWILCPVALGTVISTLIVRRRFLFLANEELSRDPHDAKGLGRWRMVTIMSMVLAMSIGLYGFMLRVTGTVRTIAWPFFLASVVLLLLWRPHLDGTTSPASPFSNQRDVNSIRLPKSASGPPQKELILGTHPIWTTQTRRPNETQNLQSPD